MYNRLYDEVVWLHAKWLEYRKLFAKSDERITLLNETASFFYTVEAVLRENVLLHIARLTDPPVQGRFENLSLRRLPDLVSDQTLAGELRKLLAAALDRCQFARDWRDKQIAHSDFSIAIKTRVATKPLPYVSRKKIEDALSIFREIMNLLYGTYLQGEVAFDKFLTQEGADELVFHLAEGVRSDERRRERLRQGKALPEDFEQVPDV